MRTTLLAIGLLLTSSAHAATRTLTHQVRLVDALGAPVEGTQTVRIRLWNDASAGAVDTDEEWVSDPIPATFSAGYATVRFTVDDTELIGDRWLSVSIGTNHLEGRTPITDVPSAPSRPSIIASGSTRTWSDGRVATSCLEYRYPDHGRQYAGVTGDGVYRVDPTGGNPADAVDLYCDMTTDGGGWTALINPFNHAQSYMEQFPSTDNTVSHYLVHANKGVSWGTNASSQQDWNTSATAFKVSLPYDEVRVVHSANYVGGMGSLRIRNQAGTFLTSRDAWNKDSNGQALSINGVAIYVKNDQVAFENREDTISTPNSTYLRIGMTAFTQYGYARRHVKALWFRRVVCGDAMVGGDETCDDGNTEDGDGCSASCVLEP